MVYMDRPNRTSGDGLRANYGRDIVFRLAAELLQCLLRGGFSSGTDIFDVLVLGHHLHGEGRREDELVDLRRINTMISDRKEPTFSRITLAKRFSSGLAGSNLSGGYRPRNQLSAVI